MREEKNHAELWSSFEYFLHFASEGICLESFYLVDGDKKTPGLGDAYLYEKITRPVLAKNSKRIKQFVKDSIETHTIEQINEESRIFQDSLTHELYQGIKNDLNAKLIDQMVNQVITDDTEQKIFILAAVYYAYYKNRHIPGYWLEPCFYTAFTPFLFFSQRDAPENIANWQSALQNAFLNALNRDKEGAYNLKIFFENKAVTKVMGHAFAGILTFINNEKERSLHFFEVNHGLTQSHLKSFKMQIANGFYTAMNKEERFFPKQKGEAQSRKGKVIPDQHLFGIISSVVDRNFYKAWDQIIIFQKSCKEGKMKKQVLRNYEKIFLGMNQRIWKETAKLIATHEQVFYRTQYLLRVVVHYLFENRDIEREYWIKYIPSVEKIINFIHRDNDEKLVIFNEDLNRIISRYREAKLFQGTDWEGFYEDLGSKRIATEVLETVVEKGRSANDAYAPAAWFSNQTTKGIDYMVLYRFFRQGAKQLQ